VILELRVLLLGSGLEADFEALLTRRLGVALIPNHTWPDGRIERAKYEGTRVFDRHSCERPGGNQQNKVRLR
jgi:hypothetical protein